MKTKSALLLAAVLALMFAFFGGLPGQDISNPANSIGGNAATATLAAKATALAANGTNCTAGLPPLGVDESGNAESCTAITDAQLSLSDVTTNNVTSSKHGFVPKSPADATQFLNGGATPAFGAITTAVITAMTSLHANDVFINSAGTAYTITATSAAATFGTTSPVITLGAAGTYLLIAKARVEMVGATFAASRVVTVQMRRTNNTAADIPATFMATNTPITSAVTQTLATVVSNALYTTALTNDSITLFADVSVLPSAGSVQVANGTLTAIRLY